MKPSVRWLAPVGVCAVIAAGSMAQSAIAGSAPSLPTRSAGQLLATLAGAHVQTFSGTVEVSAELGLPQLPGGSLGAPSADNPAALATRLLSGQSTLRVWADGPQRQRAQLLDPFAELDVVHNGRDVWTYSSHDQVATHTTLPSLPSLPTSGAAAAAAHLPTPDEVARQVLAALDPTTEVTSAAPATVAGRDSYTLLITPRTSQTLVAQVNLAIDAATGAPLRVQVFARRHAGPAFESGFTSFSTDRPAADVFAFALPKGARLASMHAPSGLAPSGLAPSDLTAPGLAPSGSAAAAAGGPKLLGSGWASIVELPGTALGSVPTVDGSFGPRDRRIRAADPLAALTQAATRVPEGRLITTSLVSVLLTDDGRLLAGSVTPQAIEAAAQR